MERIALVEKSTNDIISDKGNLEIYASEKRAIQVFDALPDTVKSILELRRIQILVLDRLYKETK